MSLMLLVHLNSPDYSKKRCFITYKCFTQLLKWNAEIYTSSSIAILSLKMWYFPWKGRHFPWKKPYFFILIELVAVFWTCAILKYSSFSTMPRFMAFLKAVDNNDFTVIAISVNSQKRCKSSNVKNVLSTVKLY